MTQRSHLVFEFSQYQKEGKTASLAPYVSPSATRSGKRTARQTLTSFLLAAALCNPRPQRLDDAWIGCPILVERHTQHVLADRRVLGERRRGLDGEARPHRLSRRRPLTVRRGVPRDRFGERPANHVAIGKHGRPVAGHLEQLAGCRQQLINADTWGATRA